MEETCELLLTEGYHSINGNDVKLKIHPDADPGSSKPQSPSVKVQTVTKFNWPKHYYAGSLITVSTKFIAYVIRGKSDAVRILNRHTASRVLLKGYHGPVCDISFAHINSPLLGAIDETGSMFIYRVEQSSKQNTIQWHVLLHVNRTNTIKNPYHRLVWSPHIHLSKDDGDEEIVTDTTFVASTSHNTIELWKLHAIIPDGTPLVTKTDDDLTSATFDGYINFEAHQEAVTDVALAPDGMVTCSASLDGLVKFWDTSALVEEKKGEPMKILHEWYPHDKSPVSCIKFLDNHLISDSEIPFWRFLLTGADQNRQLKIWCTVKWDCVQTISFLPGPSPSISTNHQLAAMKLSADQSGNYILLTDIHRRVVYCLECYSNIEEEKCMIRSANVCLIDTPVLSFHISTVKDITMMSAEEPPRRRRGVQIQSFTLHQANLYKLQTRILHHDSFLREVPNSGSGTPAGFLSPTRVLSPGCLSGDEQIYPSKSRLSSDNETESRRQRARSKTPSRKTPTKSPARMSDNENNVERKASVKEETSDMSSIIEKLKSQRRPSNSSSVSQTSTTGAIESTSGVNMAPETDTKEATVKKEATDSTSIPVAFGSDNDTSADASDPHKSSHGSCPEDEEKSEEAKQPNILQSIFGGEKSTGENPESEDKNADQKPPSLLESIFSSASKKGKGVVSLATESGVDSSLTNVTPLEISEVSNQSVPDEENRPESPHPIDAMSQLLLNLKKQTDERRETTEPLSLMGERPAAPGGKTPKVLIFGDELISDLDKVLNEPFKFAIEIHMLEGAQTKNIQKYITESIGTRKDAQVCIFHVGTNDISGRRTEGQFNTDLMLLFGACRASFPNAKLCCSSILPRHDEHASKVQKFNTQADKQCENCAVTFLNNTKIFNDVDNYVYKNDPTECVQLTREGKGSLGMHFVCYIEDSVQEGDGEVRPEMILGPKIETKLPKEGIEVRNLTPVNEDQDERDDGSHSVPDGPRPLGDGSKVSKLGRDRDGHGDGSQSPLPPTPTSNASVNLPTIMANSPIQGGGGSTSGGVLPSGGGPSAPNPHQFNELINLVRRQSDEIEKLRKEMRQSRPIHQPTHHKPDYSAKDINAKFDRLSNELKQFQRNIQNQINERLSNGTHSQKPADSLVDSLLPTVTTRLLDAIERTTTSKLNQTDGVIKEQLEKTLNSVGISMTIGKSVEQSISMVHRASMEAEVIPRFERATKEMFGQISQTFSKGTDEYVNRLEKSLERRVKAELTGLESTIAKAEDPQGRLALNLGTNIAKSLQTHIAAEIAKNSMKSQQEITQVIHKMFNLLRSHLINDIKELLQSHTTQLDIKVEDAIARAQTPGPAISDENINLRDQLKLMLEQNKFNEAFTKALMASDLPLVVELMEMVDSAKIFSPDLPGGTALEQNIILSLIQQLSVDLKTKSSVKFHFLQEAILALDLRRPSAEHIPNVLAQLQAKIQQFIETWPRDPMAKNYRMIAMTAAGMMKQS